MIETRELEVRRSDSTEERPLYSTIQVTFPQNEEPIVSVGGVSVTTGELLLLLNRIQGIKPT